jgi:hypothetical protein
MEPVISEFSYGYAVTQEFVQGLGNLISAPPEFPSLSGEGKMGGGYDVAIHSDFALFLQFKMAHKMVRDTAEEVVKGTFTSAPFFRMWITPPWRSDQHELLLELEAAVTSEGDEVYYAAPMFHAMDEFSEAYALEEVVQRSLFLPPSAMGKLSDDSVHHVAFDGNQAVVFSKPKTITRHVLTGSQLVERMKAKIRPRDAHRTPARVVRLSEKLWHLAETRERPERVITPERAALIRRRSPVEQVRFLASAIFGCESLFLRERDLG